jgi:hypothetical protein
MGYTENQIQRAGWGLLGCMIKWMFIALLVSIPLAIIVLIMFWPLYLTWSRGHQWYWHTPNLRGAGRLCQR